MCVYDMYMYIYIYIYIEREIMGGIEWAFCIWMSFEFIINFVHCVRNKFQAGFHKTEAHKDNQYIITHK